MQQVVLYICVCASAVEAFNCFLPAVGVVFGVDYAQNVVASFKIVPGYHVAEISPGLAPVVALEYGIFHLHALPYVFFQSLGTFPGKRFVPFLRAFERGRAYDLYYPYRRRGIGGHLFCYFDNPVERSGVFAERTVYLSLVYGEVHN